MQTEKLEPAVGFEWTPRSLQNRCSTGESMRRPSPPFMDGDQPKGKPLTGVTKIVFEKRPAASIFGSGGWKPGWISRLTNDNCSVIEGWRNGGFSMRTIHADALNPGNDVTVTVAGSGFQTGSPSIGRTMNGGLSPVRNPFNFPTLWAANTDCRTVAVGRWL